MVPIANSILIICVIVPETVTYIDLLRLSHCIQFSWDHINIYYTYIVKCPKRGSITKECAFNYSGFDVRLIGNVVKYHQSFVGRDYKVWAQMALSIIFPYLSCGDQAVLLSLSKLKASLFVVWALFIHFVYIFRIAYHEYTRAQNLLEARKNNFRTTWRRLLRPNFVYKRNF